MFVKKAAMKLLRKAAQLSRLALYFNTGAVVLLYGNFCIFSLFVHENTQNSVETVGRLQHSRY